MIITLTNGAGTSPSSTVPEHQLDYNTMAPTTGDEADLKVKNTSAIPKNPLAFSEPLVFGSRNPFQTMGSVRRESWMRSFQRKRSCFSLSDATTIMLLLASLLPLSTAQPQPSDVPSLSLVPTELPSITPSTAIPSISPSLMPSSTPSTSFPSVSPSELPTSLPSRTPQPTQTPSVGPTAFPTITGRPSLSPRPSESPSERPSKDPTASPTMLPSTSPTDTFWPSMHPSTSSNPTFVPTESPEPTSSPSLAPTITPKPTFRPSFGPSDYPTQTPSGSPTMLPTFSVEFLSEGQYIQQFTVPNGRAFNANQTEAFERTMAGYTINLTDSPSRIDQINVTCTILLQRIVQPLPARRGRGLFRWLQTTAVLANQVEYSLRWYSIHVNVTGYDALFSNFINANLDNVTSDLQDAGLNVTESSNVLAVLVTQPPSQTPTVSDMPSASPSRLPSLFPSEFPTRLPSASPTIKPTPGPTPSPTPGPTPLLPPPVASGNDGVNTTILAVVLVLVIVLGGVGFFLYYRRRQKKKARAFQSEAAGGEVRGAENDEERPNRYPNLHVATGDPYRRDPFDTPKSDDNAAGMISPSESLQSNQSLLSTGNSMGGDSVDEADGTHYLADEFDQYKHQNLEKVRAGVEENLNGADGMMSRAMTLALMSDEDPITDQHELYWGGTGDPIEIEASALCDVNAFLKRKEGAGIGERRTFMQDTMNKMVASVRHGVIQPEEATRTIHECAAMLGLELASELPVNTVIVTGLRKNVTKSDLETTFSEFGPIDEAAVAARSRGFGLVRFISPQSVQRAMTKFIQKEIVVQDVAVMVRILKSDDAMEA